MGKKFLTRLLAVCMILPCLFAFNACGDDKDNENKNTNSGNNEQTHVCSYDRQKAESKYLKTEATCTTQAIYYYSCTCGKAGTETFISGRLKDCDFTKEVADEKYLKEPANCNSPAVYYKSCTVCGKRGYYFQTFTYGECGDCTFSEEVADYKYLCTEATKTEAETYYKSCPICGKAGKESFPYGEPLKTYTEEEKIPYTPISLTVSLYDAENSIYGFTCNTEAKPLRPVLQIVEGEDFTGDIKEYPVNVTSASSYTTQDVSFEYYILKAEAELKMDTVYTYRIFDKYVDIGSIPATLPTKDLKDTSFSFTHISDTQQYPTEFRKVLKTIQGETDFLLHTGDVVESSKYEEEWTAMINGNFEYLSKIPMMAISGNHETTYKNGSNEIFKHFNNKLPSQSSTSLGYFYSFIYGNAKFIMLNTNDLTGNKLKSEQYDWLVKELQSNTATWTIVSMHNPMYSVGNYGANPSRNAISLALRKQLQGVFAQYGVDIVLQGHDHVVSRTYPIDGSGQPQTENWQTINGINYSVNPHGVLYLMNGTSGGQVRSPYDIDSSLYQYAEGSKASSWAQFEINGVEMKISVNYYTTNGVVSYQTWGIKKTS